MASNFAHKNDLQHPENSPYSLPTHDLVALEQTP